MMGSARLRGIKGLAAQVKRWREDVANPKRRVPLGWHALDEIVRGPAPGEVFLVLAASFVGKSMFATNVMANNPDQAVIFFSLEMPEHQVLGRLVSHVFDLPSGDLELAEFTRTLPDVVDELPARLPKQVVIDDDSLSLEDMGAYLADYETFYGERPALVIIDYLEEVGGGKASAEGYIRAEATASAVKAFAKRERVGVILLHQTKLNKPQHEPIVKADAKSAGYTEADAVIGMWRPGWDPGLDIQTRSMRDSWVQINVIKNRIRGIKREDGLSYRFDPANRIVPNVAPSPVVRDYTEPVRNEWWRRDD